MLSLLNPSRWTGPIFGKELRVVSRQRRAYAMRAAYLALMGLFVAIFWLRSVPAGLSEAARADRMAEAGKTLAATIGWVQFLAIQLIAVVLTSTTISDEVYHGTLATLMTTPITSFQIVMGKLLSKMLQLVQLVILSVPLLAVLRVFGGIPWDFVLASTCITLTTALVAGAVTMLFSAMFRRSYVTLLTSLGVGLGLYVILPWILMIVMVALAIATMASGARGQAMSAMSRLVMSIHPGAAMLGVTAELFTPGTAGMMSFSWVLHCGGALIATLLILLLCAVTVRRVAVKKAFGSPAPTGLVLLQAVPSATAVAAETPKPAKKAPHSDDEALPLLPLATAEVAPAPPVAAAPAPMPVWTPVAAAVRIRRVNRSPMVWKELAGPLLRGKTATLTLWIVGMSMTVLIYVLFGALGSAFSDDVLKVLSVGGVQAFFTVTFVLAALGVTVIMSAMSVVREKEARTMAMLLTTPLTAWQILLGKAAGVAYRCMLAWFFLIGHVLIFTVVGVLSPAAALHLVMLIVWIHVFLIGLGQYFGACFKRTTPAIIVILAVFATIWIIVPIVVPIIEQAVPNSYPTAKDTCRSVGDAAICANPIVQTVVVTMGACREEVMFSGYNWPGGKDFGATTLTMFYSMLGYAGMGLLFVWLAARRLRRKVF